MYLLFVVCVWIIFGIIFVDWKNWKPFYPTILYYGVVNLLYDYLYYNHTLWAYRAITTPYLNHTIISIVFLFMVIPIALLIYLQRFPRDLSSQIGYILIFAFFFWIIEYLFYVMGMFVYDHGWNVWHSLWFDVLMFTMFRIHQKKPGLILVLTVIVVVVFISVFPVPFSSLK